jgi:hypothetical protein
MQTRLGLFVECVMAAVVVVCLAGWLQQPWRPAEPFANPGRFSCGTKQNRLA